MDETRHILERVQSPSKENTKSEEPKKSTVSESPMSSKSDLHQLVEGDWDQETDKPRSNVPMTSFNFINSIIGSGIIGMPYALHLAGFGMGIILIIVVTIVTDHSLLLLIHAGEISNTNSYQDVMRAAFGRTGFIVLTIMQFLYPLIAMISYNIIIGDTVTKIVLRAGGEALQYSLVGKRQFIICVVTLLITLPLSLYRNIARLSKVSLLSIVFIIFIIGVMIAKGFTMNVPQTTDAWQFANTGITQAIGIMAFAYMCHHNSFLIYDSMVEPNERRWGVVTHVSVFIAMVCTFLLGITGYATFTGLTQGDVLENYCHADDLVNVARFLFACTIMLTFPIECFVTREVIENAVFAFKQPPPLWRHLVSTIGIVVLTVIISMATDCLGIVLELNGVLNAAPLAYIFPPLCVMKLKNERFLSLGNVPAILITIFGVLVSVVGVIMAIIEMAHGVTCSHGQEMPYCLHPGDKPSWNFTGTSNSSRLKLPM